MKFNEESHSYFNDDGEIYLSATSFIKKFCKPFQRDKIAARYAKKHKKKVQDVIDEWTKISEVAMKKGTHYHKIKEDELIGKGSIFLDEVEHTVHKPFWHEGLKIQLLKKLEPGIYPELIVWSDKYKIAGQIDYAEITKSGYININDYKTSKEIKKQGYEKWDGSREMMNYPLNNLDDCNFSTYSLQLNLYAFLIKQHNRNLKIGKLTIEHVVGEFEDDQFVLKEVKIHKVPNLQVEIKTALDYYKDQQHGN